MSNLVFVFRLELEQTEGECFQHPHRSPADRSLHEEERPDSFLPGSRYQPGYVTLEPSGALIMNGEFTSSGFSLEDFLIILI